ncbi:MAG: PPK2 family polyphosphate kinase [Myxococcota bacterium]|nr:PPK2 family polyphosphate kinase [Myxococcota bacterium]
MFEPTSSLYRVPFDGSFRVADQPTRPPKDRPSKEELKEELKECVEQFDELQRRLYAADSHSVLLIFQALDAAGKDSTIRAVTSGVNPAGFQVHSFKAPSPEELDHDFLWRSACRLPERGRIGIFNRSYYEEVLVVRVHPEYLAGQRLPPRESLDSLWAERFQSIREHEEHLARNGVVVLKFWLNISMEEQAKRFLSRIESPEKNWKFSKGDLEERACWDSYMEAFEEAISATSRPWAPWYAIPADNKPWMRLQVARCIVASLRDLDPRYPTLSAPEQDELEIHRESLLAELS